MARTAARISVDISNPGQVFACLGFLEAAEVLLGRTEAHFCWSNTMAEFVLEASGYENPLEVVLDFLATANIVELAPIGYVEGGAPDVNQEGDEDDTPANSEDDVGEASNDMPGDTNDTVRRRMTPGFPSEEGKPNSLPIQLVSGSHVLTLSHWADGSSRSDFKLYSGNRSARNIAMDMLQGVRTKPRKNQSIGDLKNRGLQQLWQEQRDDLLKAPFDVVTPMGGSFNLDSRGAWTAIDAGYSPDTQKDHIAVAASPIVEILAAIGLEHTRPDEYEIRKVYYTIWRHPLPPMLARAVLAGADLKVPTRRFQFDLSRSGKNKVTTFAQEEAQL